MIIPRWLEPLWRLCPKDDNVRWNMRCVRVERDAGGEPYAIVCDGRVMLVCQFDEPYLPGPALPEKPGFGVDVPDCLWKLAFQLARRDAKAQGHLVLNETDDGAVAIHFGTDDVSGLRCNPPAGRFPDWRSVAEPRRKYEPKSSEKVSLHAQRLASLCDVLRRMEFDRVDFAFAAPGSSLYCCAQNPANGGGFIEVYLMPLS